MKKRHQESCIDLIRLFAAKWRSNHTTPEEWDSIGIRVCELWDDYLQDVIDSANRGGYGNGRFCNPAVDSARLTRQIGQVWDVFSDGQPHTVPEVKARVGAVIQESIDAQIRHLCRPWWGSWVIRKVGHTPAGLLMKQMFNPDGTPGPPWMEHQTFYSGPRPPGWDRPRRRANETQ